MDAPTEDAHLVRFAAITALQRLVSNQSLDELGTWARMFRVSQMFAKKGTYPKIRCVFALSGSCSLPSAEAARRLLTVLKDKATTEDEAEQELRTAMVAVEGVPESPAGKGVPLERLFGSVLALFGAQRMVGRAPTGALAWRLRRGDAGADEEDEEG